MTSKRSIRIIAISLENAPERVASSRQSFLEQGQYEDYLMLAEFSQFRWQRSDRISKGT